MRKEKKDMLSKAVISMMQNPTDEQIKKIEERVEAKVRGNALRQVREHLGVSQAVFADILNITEEEVANLELKGIDAAKLQKIQETYGA
jgi:DNA-binding transcriptional regulator YiaG